MDKKTKVTICLLTWNGQDYLPFQLKSLVDQTFQDWQLLVIDNGSADNSVSVINEYYPPAKVVRQKNNLGFAKANNLLLKWSNSEYVLFLNQDIILESDYLEKTVAFLDANPNVATVAGKLLYWDFPNLKKTKIVDSLGLKINRQRAVVDISQGEEDVVVKKNQEVFGLSGALFLARRQALETIKIPKGLDDFEYFDEDFFSYKEDVDLAWRLRLMAWENWLLISTQAYHHRSVKKNKLFDGERRKRGILNKLSYRNHLATIYKNSFAQNFVKDFFPIIWYEFRKLIYALFFEPKTLLALGEFLKLKKRLKKKKKFIKQHRRAKAEDIYYWFKS